MAMPVHTRIQKLRQLPPGRAHQAAANVARVAFPLGYVMLMPFTDAVREAARHYLDLRTRRFGERGARGDGEAGRIDRKVDIRTGFVHDNLRRYAVDLADTDEGRLADRLLRRYFPRGLGAVTNAPFEEELIQLEDIVEGLTGDDAPAARALTINHHVEILRPLVERYGRALDQQPRVTAAELRSAWQALHQRVLELAFAIITHVPDPEQRAKILGPIFEQDDRLAALYAARQKGRGATDFDLDAEAEALDGGPDDPTLDEEPVLDDDVELPVEGSPEDALPPVEGVDAPPAADAAPSEGDTAPPRPLAPLPGRDG